MKKVHFVAWGFILTSSLVGCATPPPQPVSEGHIQERPQTPSNPPPLVRTLTPPPINPEERKRIETYSVVVKDVDIRDLLFSLARDAKVDVDISPDVKGSVTLNAVKQSLPQILDRLSANFDMAYEVVDGTYRITPDKPVLKSYRIEYPNITRTSTSDTTSKSLSGDGTGESKTQVATISAHDFWGQITKNIKEILQDTDREISYRRLNSNDSVREKVSADFGKTEKVTGVFSPVSETLNNVKNAPSEKKEKSPEDIKVTEVLLASNVIVNPETGIIQVRATNRQHTKVKEFIDLLLSSASRQVLIEVTIAEVKLSQNYQKGIDWGAFRNLASGSDLLLGFGNKFTNTLGSLANGISAINPLPINTAANTFELGYTRSSNKDSFITSIKLLEEFGNVKILSSPKLSVLNNQTALMKVVENYLYFEAKSTTTDATGVSAAKTTYTTTVKTIPVGFVMSVTPFIGVDGMVQLNIRPSISRVIGRVQDPNPDLKIENYVPVTSSREIESIMRVSDGNIAVLGGLMEDTSSADLSGLPGLTRSPVLGEVFGNTTQDRSKTELVIFIRPRVVRNADLSGDYNDFQRYLMNDSSFQAPHPALEQK